MASILEIRRRAIDSELRDSLPVIDETAVDLSLLTDEQLAQVRQLTLAASIKAATTKKDQ
jgi:hypothetical protein